jgi:hypothetical protein
MTTSPLQSSTTSQLQGNSIKDLKKPSVIFFSVLVSGSSNIYACQNQALLLSFFTHDFAKFDFGSGWEPLEDCHLSIHFVWVLSSEFPSPTLSISLETGIPAKEDMVMTTIGFVGFHSFFLSNRLLILYVWFDIIFNLYLNLID